MLADSRATLLLELEGESKRLEFRPARVNCVAVVQRISNDLMKNDARMKYAFAIGSDGADDEEVCDQLNQVSRNPDGSIKTLRCRAISSSLHMLCSGFAQGNLFRNSRQDVGGF